MQVTTSPFDPAKYLDSDEAIAVYMTEALDSKDPRVIADSIGVIARARGRQSSLRNNLRQLR